MSGPYPYIANERYAWSDLWSWNAVPGLAFAQRFFPRHDTVEACGESRFVYDRLENKLIFLEVLDGHGNWREADYAKRLDWLFDHRILYGDEVFNPELSDRGELPDSYRVDYTDCLPDFAKEKAHV